MPRPVALLLGQIGDESFSLPDASLRKHAVVLGASGSGKTVLCKSVIEEAVLAGIPSILIDPQGDLASLALPGNVEKIGAEGGDLERRKAYLEKAEVRIFTPASSRGIPMSCDPLEVSRDGLSEEEVIHTLDLIATSLTLLLGYDLEVEKGKSCKALLYNILERGHYGSSWPKSLEEFAERVESIWKSIEAEEEWEAEVEAAKKAERMPPKRPEKDPLADVAQSLTDMGTMKSVSRNLRFLAVGVNKLIFSFGVGISLDRFLEPVSPGKTPVNVIYLNTLQSDEQKHFFTAMVAREVYNWMLKNPLESQDSPPQLLFYIDEVSTFMPAGAREPPAEPILRLIFKQGRKYGVSMVVTTQNFGDLDYKSMAQASTWAIGRLTVKQDHEKIKPILKALNVEAEEIPKAVGALKPGNFAIISPDLHSGYKTLKVRWLYSEHRTLPDDELRDAMGAEMLAAFDRQAKGSQRIKEELKAPTRTEEEKEEPPAAPSAPAPGAAVAPAAPDAVQLPEFPDPAAGPVPAILGRLAVSKDQAVAAAARAAGGVLQRPEARAIAMRWMPLWQIEIGAKKGLFSGLMRRGAPDYVYMSGERELLMVVKDRMRFQDSVPPDPKDIVDIDGAVQWTSQGVDPAACLPPEIKQADAASIARRTFGADVAAVRLCYLPVWVVEMEGRRISIDGVLGKEVVF
jgi:hypothetical protein